ncbi:MAG: glycosyltransferase family 39 protein [Anaerolineae bacterium]|nr:glycosyltransferase family 39 protein [Phycisphaerae bacterium]
MNAKSIHRGESTRTRISAVLLVVLTLIVMGRLCAAEFVQVDDPQTIANNPAFNPPQVAKIAEYWIKPEGSLYIPLTYSVWGALAFIARVAQPDEFGSFLNPWVFHTANVVLHCITTLIVFAILRAIVKNRSAAWVGAAIFAVHPVQVETVAWASGTKDLLCALFICAAVLALLRSRERNRGVILANVFTLAACFSKPTGIIAPAVLLIIDTLVCGTNWRRSLRTLWPTFVIAVAFAIVGVIVQPPLMTEVTPLWQRPLVALDALSFYVWKLLWPANLGIDYGRTPARIIASGAIWWTWIVPVALIAIVVAARNRLIIAGISLFILGVAPVLGLVPFTFQTISTVADHYMYPAMLGVALLVATATTTFEACLQKRCQEPFSGKRFLTPFFVGCVLMVFLLMRAFAAAGTWRNNSTLFANALDVNPRSAFSHTNWGVALAKHGDESAALDHFRQAVAVDPDYAFGHSNLGGFLRARGQYTGAAAEYRELLRVYRKQRNFDPALGVSLQQVIDQLEQLAARHTTQPTAQPATQPTTQEAR